MCRQWRHGGARIPERSERREAFNIMLSMPAGTKPEIVRNAVREFAKAELANHSEPPRVSRRPVGLSQTGLV
jgi:hypothetical protein